MAKGNDFTQNFVSLAKTIDGAEFISSQDLRFCRPVLSFSKTRIPDSTCIMTFIIFQEIEWQ